jgi:hypothetical protein
MPLDQRQGSKVIKSARREEASGTRVDPHPYIGIVKNNLDPTRCGRLQVWIPDLGGNQDDSKNWRTVSYASPFMGTTNIVQKDTNRTPNKDNKFTNTPHTYGMWMVPPDIGVEVICIFIAGDPLRGYWIACTNSSISRHMLPGMASSTNTDVKGASSDVKNSYKTGVPAPVTEFNDNDPATYQQQSFYNNPKPIHEPQYRILKIQGLDRDAVRGTVTSSSQRETPSNVFGISTPGRPFPDDGAINPSAFVAKVRAGKLREEDYAYTTRAGGHTFIMDDGDLTGRDQLIRLRTAQGHQIMMHDAQNTLYISHSDGTSWVELTSEGAVNIYAKNGFNVRSEGSINMHADKNININAGGRLNLSAGSKFQVDAGSMAMLSAGAFSLGTGGALSLKSDSSFNVEANGLLSLKAGGTLAMDGSSISRQSGASVSVKKPEKIQINQLPDVAFESSTGLYVQSAKLSTIVSVAPSHEPYARNSPSVFAPYESDGIQPATTYKEGYDAAKNANGTHVGTPASEADLRIQPKTDCTIGNLNSNQMTAYFAQIGKSESGGKYDIVNTIGYVGKYQFGYLALIDAGYVAKNCKSNAQLRNPNSWSPNKNGIDSLEKWLASQGEQEAAMCELTKRNYTAMCKNGSITKDMKPEEVAGMLAVSHLLGAGGANTWRKGAGGADAYGTTGEQYFAKGKYAIAVLAPKIPAVDIG